MNSKAHASAVVDTNVVLRHLLDDIPAHSLRANALFEAVMRGDIHVYAPSTVFFEVAYVLTQRNGVSPRDAAHALTTMLGYPGLVTDHPKALVEGLQFWAAQGPLSFADCFHLALTRQLGMDRIYTFDQKMDHYPGVTRIEP